MKRRKTPQEKKADEYTKDHVVLTESVHGFRKTWPRKKAYAMQAYRRKVHQMLDTVSATRQDDLPEEIDPGSIRRKVVTKWGISPKGKAVAHKRKMHATLHPSRFFAHEYSSADRQPFIAFLKSHTVNRTTNSPILAEYLHTVMGPPRYHWTEDDWPYEEKGRRWLQAFFRDEPEWEERLKAWIASFDL